MGLFGGCGVNESSVAACSKQMHAQLIQRQHVLKVVHQLKKVGLHSLPALHVVMQQNTRKMALQHNKCTLLVTSSWPLVRSSAQTIYAFCMGTHRLIYNIIMTSFAFLSMT